MAILIDFDGIDGDATLKDHIGWVEALGFTWDGSLSRSENASSKRTGVVYSTAVVTKRLDRASTQLFRTLARCQSGHTLKTVKVHVTNVGNSGPGNIRYELVLKEVRVLAVGQVLSDGDGTETVELDYRGFVMNYFDAETGKAVNTVDADIR